MGIGRKWVSTHFSVYVHVNAIEVITAAHLRPSQPDFGRAQAEAVIAGSFCCFCHTNGDVAWRPQVLKIN